LPAILLRNNALLAESAQMKRLLKQFDCTSEYPADTYFGHGDVKVVASAAGRYREAEAVPLSRFGYRFKVERIGKPHLAVVRYPDDKRRHMCMMDGTSYDLTVCVFTGVNQPLSGKMLEIRRIFWPRWNDCSIVFMTWGHGDPAAVASIKIYELEDLPALKVSGDRAGSSRREFGLQFEDPCGKGASLGAINHLQWLDRMVDYMLHSGQKLLTYPIVWYHHPHYPSEIEPSGDFPWVAAPDRKIYCPWTTKPTDWVAHTLERFGREGLEFQASLTLLRLGSLMKDMNIDLESIKAGKDTYNNMLNNNQVQSSTMDWTPLYNVVNLQKQAEGCLEGWAYGERSGPFGKGAMFNPLHPTVRQAILGIAQEIANRYAKYPAFKGISINMWHATIAWFSTLKAGYDDYTISLFEKETKIKAPVDPQAPDRFSQRYDFLVGKHLDKWIDWRCQKIRELFRRMRDTVIAARQDLRLTVTMWTETTIPGWLGIANSPAHQLYARKSTYDLYREGGFDVDLYRHESGIETDLSFCCSRDRDAGSDAGENTPLESSCMFRDHDFLDSITLAAMNDLPRPGVFVFDCWVEAWGKHTQFPCSPDDAQARELAVSFGKPGKPAEGIYHMNCEYPKDGFWWDWQFRVTPCFQGGVHYLEPFVHALAELDACRITRGGLFLDTAHTDEIQSFVRAYRALPAQKFQTVGTSTDPVAVRTKLEDNRRYVYMVNREYYPVEMKIKLKNGTGKAIDLATNQTIDAPANWRLILGPYGLRSFALPADAEVVGFTAIPPRKIAAQLRKHARDVIERIEKMAKAAKELPVGTNQMVSGIKKALREGRLAWLRRALDSYIIKKCDQLWSDPKVAMP